MKHTPGPWNVRKTATTIRIVGPNIRAVNNKTVANVRLRDGSYHDARLIAAAPELLEALKLANEMLNHLYKKTNDDAPDNVDHGKVRLAIAKAEGE
jgi:hypothetical protein